MGVIQFMHEVDHGMLHARAKAQVAALAPAADGVTARPQEGAQRARGGVRRNEAGQHQHGMPVAMRRKAKQRQRAEEGAEFREGSPFQEHESPGRRAKRLGSNGHRFSCSGWPLASRQPANWARNDANAKESFCSAALSDKKAMELFLAIQDSVEP